MKHVVTAARVLVTAFGSFPGTAVNPTEAILVRLQRRKGRLARLGIELHEATLPVVFQSLEARLSDVVGRSRPDAILHLGLAGRRRVVSVETRALNRAGLLHPDAGGDRPAGLALVQGAPFSLRTTYADRAIEAAIRRLQIPVARSIDAGDYVCNATLYRTLAARSAACIGFLHVPRPRERRPRGRNEGHRKPTVDQLADAAFAAILLMMRPGPRGARRPAVGAPKVPTTNAGREGRLRPAPGRDADRPAA